MTQEKVREDNKSNFQAPITESLQPTLLLTDYSLETWRGRQKLTGPKKFFLPVPETQRDDAVVDAGNTCTKAQGITVFFLQLSFPLAI